MFINEVVIGVIFRILNFAVVIVFFAYLFKKFALDTIKNQIASRKRHREQLNWQIKELDQAYHVLDKQIIEQDELCKKFIEKIKKWRHAFDDAERLKKREQLKMKVHMEERAKIYADWIVAKRLQQHVIPTALLNAREQLSHQFESEDQGNQFLNKLIKAMEKST